MVASDVEGERRIQIINTRNVRNFFRKKNTLLGIDNGHDEI